MTTTVAALLADVGAQVGTYERTGQNDILYADYWGITGYAWCYAFVQWCFDTIGARLPHITMYVPSGVQYCRDAGQNIERGGAPQPGDIVHFTWDMANWPPDRPGTGDHVGLVEGWDGGDTLYTIEGNIGSPQGVHRIRRSIHNTVINFWRPPVYTDTGGEDVTPEEHQMLVDTAARALYCQELLQQQSNTLAAHDTMLGWLLNDTKTQTGLQVGPAVGNLSIDVRRNTRVRLITDDDGKLWISDLTGVFPVDAATADHLAIYGYFNNDINDKGKPIPQKWTNAAVKALPRHDLSGEPPPPTEGVPVEKVIAALDRVGDSVTTALDEFKKTLASSATDAPSS